MFKTKRVTGKDHMYQPNLARQTIQYNDIDEMRISTMISMAMMFTGCLTKTCPVAPSL